MNLESRLLLSASHFDFGTSTSPVSSEYLGVPVAGYNSASGFGWASTSGITAADRGTSDALTRDFHAGTDATFRVKLANGTYKVRPTLGDAKEPHDGISVYVNGTKRASNLSTAAGQTLRPTYGVRVTTGELTVRLVDTGGATPHWTLNALDIVSYTGPTANAGPDQSGKEGSSVAFNGTASGSGPLTYLWNFGNGKTATGTLTPKHTYADNGTYTASLTVTDAYGLSSKNTAVIAVANLPPRPINLGPFTGVAGTAVHFVGVAREASTVDLTKGLAYSWNFGDGKTATGPIPDHTYASAGIYTVTMKVADKDGGSKSITTTATIVASGTSIISQTVSDYGMLSSNLLANTVYGQADWSPMASTGAWGVNAQWEQGKSSTWHIELQRYGEDLILGGLMHNNTSAIAAGFKAFDWGFAHQASNGSFQGTADPFHATSFFVEAVAHTLLAVRQSPYAEQYQAKVDSYISKLYSATKWMVGSTVWSNGLKNDSPYTHRRYIVADALAMTSSLVGGDSNLMSKARSQIQTGLSLQWSNGVNPEKSGYDSSYQTAGLRLAELWVTYFPTDSLTPSVRSMIEKGLNWEKTRILSTGEVSMSGNTRTGVESGTNGSVKSFDWRSAVSAFGYWFQATGNTEWQAAGQKIAQYYYQR